MRSVKKGKNVNVPLTKRVYDAHIADLSEWLEDAEKNHPTQTVKLKERVQRVNTHWLRFLGGENVSVNVAKKGRAKKESEVSL